MPALDAVVLAAESADVDALQRLADFDSLATLGTGKYEQKSSRDRGKPLPPLEQLMPILADGNRDMNNFVCKSQDAKLNPNQLVAYNFDEAQCPESYVHGAVLTRHVGSGRMVRFWLTAMSISSAEAKLGKEMLRIYVDDHPAPVYQVPLADALSGAAGEVFAAPFGAASPNFIAWYYPVVFSTKVVVAIDNLESDYYFQTDAVLDAEPQPRRAPRARLAERDRAREVLRAPALASAKELVKETLTLASGAEHEARLTGPATIQELSLRVDAAALASLAGVTVSVHWDGADQAALTLPLLDLFAASTRPVEASNFVLAASQDAGQQQLTLRLPMPFRETAVWRVINTGATPVSFELTWRGVDAVPAGELAHLHVQRNDVPIPASELQVTVAQASGRGRYVGMCADVAGNTDRGLGVFAEPMNFLEGDFRADVDGRRALDGTGAEDYPDNSFYFEDCPKATPFAQSWARAEDAMQTPNGAASYCRWQVLGNEIDFASEFVLKHELSQRDPSIAVLHRTVAFLYLP